MKPIIRLKGLSKHYPMPHGTVHAIRNINLEISSSEFIAIMGPSGSGKSTLLHLLGCLDTPSEGSYLLNNQNISHLNDTELALIRSSQIGFVFQSFNLIPQLNVYENVEVPFLYQQIPAKKKEEKILQSIERVGLKQRMFHLPSQLSGGETQRVAIARALAIEPLLILADEPTGNLDSETGKTILKLFQELNCQGATIILITHDEQVGAYCQRILRMRDGCLISEIESNTK